MVNARGKWSTTKKEKPLQINDLQGFSIFDGDGGIPCKSLIYKEKFYKATLVRHQKVTPDRQRSVRERCV